VRNVSAPRQLLETHWFYGRGTGVGWRGRGVHLPVHGVVVGVGVGVAVGAGVGLTVGVGVAVGVGCGGIGALIQVITSLFTCSQ
jgi:hypothetical protein